MDKADIKKMYDSVASSYGDKRCSYFQYFGKSLVDLSKVMLGGNVLDVATGKGAILFPLADAVGCKGKVTGIDISGEMIKETSNLVKEKNLNKVNLQQMDAENLLFPENTFDFVFCGFALFFFPSLSKALSEFRRVLKLKGKFAFSIWKEKPSLSSFIRGEIENLKFSTNLTSYLYEKEELYSFLKKMGFNNIEIIQEVKDFYYETPDMWWDSLWTHGTKLMLEKLSKKQLDIIHARALAKANSLLTRKGVVETFSVYYGFGEK